MPRGLLLRLRPRSIGVGRRAAVETPALMPGEPVTDRLAAGFNPRLGGP